MYKMPQNFKQIATIGGGGRIDPPLRLGRLPKSLGI